MKKITSKLLVLMMVLVMTFGLSACGNKDKETVSSGTSQNADNDDSASDDSTDDSSNGSAPYDTVSDYINDEQIQKTFSSIEQALEGSGMSVKITAEDNKLIYTYTYDQIEKTDDMAAQLEEAVSAQDTTFQSVANSIIEYVNIDTAIVDIRYVDCNGEEIYSKEYVSE